MCPAILVLASPTNVVAVAVAVGAVDALPSTTKSVSFFVVVICVVKSCTPSRSSHSRSTVSSMNSMSFSSDVSSIPACSSSTTNSSSLILTVS
eukprot:jgi/Phyca11/510543/fgenesh2_kg.PHYCAscaffold_62_\